MQVVLSHNEIQHTVAQCVRVGVCARVCVCVWSAICHLRLEACNELFASLRTRQQDVNIFIESELVSGRRRSHFELHSEL